MKWIGKRGARDVGRILLLVGILLAANACNHTDESLVYVTPANVPSPTPFQPRPGSFDSLFDTQPVEPTSTAFPYGWLVERSPTPDLHEPSSLNLSVDINPLTGLPPSDPALLERRPLAIKISNYPREIRPQYGLTSADQVFEYYIEWGDTRFVGIFYGQNASQVGPVRSGRYFDAHITRMYHAFYVFNFADPRELGYFKESDLALFLVTPGCEGCACPPFFVFNPGRLADENHLTTYFDATRASECYDLDRLNAGKMSVDNSRQPLRNGFFSEAVPTSENFVNRIYTMFSSRDYHYWQYDPQMRKYFRFQEVGDTNADFPETYAPLMDAGTNQQVNAENVVILFARYTFANDFNAEDEVYNIDLISSGSAVVFRDGIAMPARWLRPEVDQPLFLTTPEGSPIFLRPGRTFYEVLGASSTYYQDESGWHYHFLTP